MNKEPTISDFLLLIFWSFIYLFIVFWFREWYLLPGLLLIIDGFITRFIPWKRIFSRIHLPVRVKNLLDWPAAIFIALIITVAIKTIFIEAYKIPTPSMEKTLLVGDYLFVSKLSYGPKLPNTPLSLPFLPGIRSNGKRSYSERIQLPYYRLGGDVNVKRNDIIVFNFPEGDTIVAEYPGQDYYSLVRQYGREYLNSNYHVVACPVDKRDTYIKRCIGLPGDTLSVRAARVFINEIPVEEFPDQQFKFYVRTLDRRLDDTILSKIGINKDEINYNPSNKIHTLLLSIENADYLNGLSQVRSVQRYTESIISFKNKELFPHEEEYEWTVDQFGPIVIPGKGLSFELTLRNLPLYKRIIEVYEDNKVQISGNEIYINGKITRYYTFKMDYYFVLGDNRHNSLDSRFWGFVPEDHLVGKAKLIWFSREPGKNIFKGLRIKRLFKTIN